jgi:hypothetical protein
MPDFTLNLIDCAKLKLWISVSHPPKALCFLGNSKSASGGLSLEPGGPVAWNHHGTLGIRRTSFFAWGGYFRWRVVSILAARPAAT